MKKISAVLLVLVLVGSVAFAGFTGSVDTSFGFDLDETNYGFKNGVKLSGELNFFELLVDNAGKGDVYAEIKAELSLGLDFEDVGNKYNPVESGLELDDSDDIIGVTQSGFAGVAKITSAKIIGDNWYVGILGAMEAPDFAASAVDTWDDGDEAANIDTTDAVAVGAGVEVGFADYKFGLSIPYGGSDNNVDNKNYNIMVTAATPDFEFADGLTMAFGTAGRLSDAGNAVTLSAKADYEVDELALSFATDAVVVGKDFDVEVAVNAVYDFVTVDAYYATKVDVEGTDIENLLSVKAAATIDAFKVVVTGKDLVNAQDLGLSVDWDATDELAVNVNGGYTIASTDYYAGAGVTYTVDEFTAALKGKYSDNVDTPDAELKMEASIESKTLVDGATLYAKWASENLLDDPAKMGSITVGAKIAF